jgi:hypothetical protein
VARALAAEPAHLAVHSPSNHRLIRSEVSIELHVCARDAHGIEAKASRFLADLIGK